MGLEGAFDRVLFGFSRRRPEEKLADAHCSFCKKSRALVSNLVAGPDAAICDECAALSIAALEESPSLPDDSFPFVAMALVHVVGSPAVSDQRAEVAAQAALEIAGTPRVLRLLAARALGAERYAIAVQAGERIPPEERSDLDPIISSSALWYLKAFEEGLAVVDGLEPESPVHRAWVMQVSAAHRLRMEGELDESWLEQTVLAIRRGTASGHFVAADVACTTAECLVRLGRLTEARDELRSKEKAEDLTALDWMILGDVALGLGHEPEALEHYAKSAELGGVTTEEVAVRVAKISPYR